MTSFKWEELPTANLVVDATYESKRQRPLNLSCEPMSRLLPGVGNMGGFRRSVSSETKKTIALILMSTGKESAWPDELDVFQGIYTYYGDNRAPGTELHDTPKKGNIELRNLFVLAHGTKAEREECPLILIFQNSGKDHDAIFKGIAVPGTKNLSLGEDLIAVWATEGNQRYQNYKATFTVLDAGEISGEWVRQVIKTKVLDYQDERTPLSLKKWVNFGEYHPLTADPIKITRSIAEQTPLPGVQTDLIESILEYCHEDPWLFEGIAASIWEMSLENDMKIDLTRKWRDGGRDAIGHLIIGPKMDPIKINFALEAKCLTPPNKVGVHYMSRLISRLKHREFGVMVTTSAVDGQAYEEVRQDGHPVVVIAGRDISEILIRRGINTSKKLKNWLDTLSFERLT